MKTNIKLLALFLLFGTLMFWPVILGKVNLNGNLLNSFYGLYGQNLPFKNTGWDQLRIYFPFYQVTFEQMKAGIVPLWNPYAFSGHPHAADFQSAVFYPFNVFGLILPLIDFWHLLRISPGILAAFFTYLFLKNRKLSMISSIFGAVTFGFSPFILTWGEEVVMSPHSIIWLPLILLGIDRFGETQERKYLGLIAVSSAFSFLAGYMQTSIYLFIFVGAYLLLKTGLENLFLKIKGLLILLAFGLGAGLAGIQVIPSAELFFNSARSQIALTKTLYDFLLPFDSLLTFLAPDFFGSPARGNFFRFGSAQYYEGILFIGIAALVFATFTILYKNKDKLTWFLIASLVISLLSTLDSPISRWFLTLPIPFLSTSIPNRILFIPAFCFAVLAATGMDFWLRGKIKTWGTLGFYAFSYLLIVLTLVVIKLFGLPYFAHAAFKSPENVLTTFRNLIIPIGVFGISGILIFLGEKTSRRYLAGTLIVAVAMVQTFYFSQKYFTFSLRERVFPQNEALEFIKKNQKYDRSWALGQNFFPNNLASFYGIYWPGGYDSLNNRAYGEFSYAMQGHEFSSYSFRADAGLGDGDAWEMFDKPPNEAKRRTLLNMVGTRYLIAQKGAEETLQRRNFNKVFQGEKTTVFENLEALPRVLLASNYEGPPPLADVSNMTDEQIAKERRKLIFQRLLDPTFDWRTVLILEKSSPISPQYGEGNAEITSYKPNEVVVETKSDQPKLLLLTDNYYPGWKATVDGEETEILRANYTFRAVPLVAGEHSVRFYYDPMSFKLGVILSSLSLIGVILLVRPKMKSS